MALKRVLEKEDFEKLEDAIKALYVEKDNKYHLDVEPSDADDIGDKTKGKTVPLSRLNEEIAKRKASDETIAAIAKELRESVPEQFTELIPDLPPGKLITWIRNAESRGFFTEKTIDSPDKKRPGDKATQDLSGLSPQAKMAQGYNTK